MQQLQPLEGYMRYMQNIKVTVVITLKERIKKKPITSLRGIHIALAIRLYI